jgi:mono/diheme cytochrome c family protein
MTVFLRSSFGAALALATLWAGAASAADPQNGERLARRWCATCHVVTSDQRQATGEAAPFSAIAKMPGFNEAKLALYLLAPHPPMPDMNLSRSEAADLADYIEGLGR